MLYSIWIWFFQCLGFDPRGIFSFHDGRRNRHVDPIVIARRLWTAKIEQAVRPGMVAPPLPFDSDTARKLIATGLADEMQHGYSHMSQAAKFVFGVKPLEEGGLTELECAELVDRFEAYLGDVKKNAKISPIGSGSTVACLVDALPASSISASGSASIANSSGEPELLDSEQKPETAQL